MKSNVLRILSVSLILIVVSACLFLLTSCSDEEAVTKIVSAEIKSDKSNVKVVATLDAEYAENHSKDTLYLLALPTADTSNISSDAEVVAESKAKGKMTFTFPLVSDSGDNLVCSAFVLAESKGASYTAITKPMYISNPELLASYNSSDVDCNGIKGLNGSDVYSAEYLGAEHVMFDISINDIILEDYREGSVKFNHEGKSYFFDGAVVEDLDKLIRESGSLGLRVYLRTVLTYPEKIKGGDYVKEPIEALFCDGIKKGKDGYLVNIENDLASDYIKALYSFLATRYSGEYGNVTDYIIGKSVNNYSNFCNAGKLSSEEFENVYSAWVRIADQTLRSVNSGARVYVPVDNSWRTDSTDDKIGSKVFLTRFAARASESGDYDWSVALNLGNGDDMPSVLSGEGYDYSNLGLDNLSEFVTLMESMDMRYKSECRRYIIDNLSLSTDISEKNRAAYYTYAYYQAAALGFDAIVYTDIESSSVSTSNGSRSDLYYAFLMCGSDVNAQLADYTQKIPNTKIPEFDSYISRELTYSQTAKFELSDSVLKNKRSFPISLSNFSEMAAVYNAQLVKDNGRTSLLIESNATAGTGAVAVFDVMAEDIIGSGYIGITMSSKTSPTVALIITDTSSTKTDVAFVGETKTVNGEATYYFDITEFAKNTEPSHKLNISICLLPQGDENNSSVEISDISLYGSSGAGTGAVITVIIVAVVVIALGVVIFLLVRRRKRTTGSRRENAD